jgi:ribosome-associated protein
MQDFDSDILPEGPSKSQRKRDMTALQGLGLQLTEARDALLKKCNLPDRLSSAIAEYKILHQNGAKRRQIQYIGKLMRDLDDNEVDHILRLTDQNAMLQQRRHLEMDQMLINFLGGDDSPIEVLLQRNPLLDIQQLRQFIRMARKEQKQEQEKAQQKELQNVHQKDPKLAAQRAAGHLYNTSGSRKLLNYLREITQI